MFRSPVLTSQRTQCVRSTNTKMISVYCEILEKHLTVPRG